MNHNCSAVLAIDPRTVNDSVYQKTLGINDFYLGRRARRPAARQHPASWPGNGADPEVRIPRAPEWALDLMSRRSVDWYAMSEDLPNPESRVTVQGGQIRLDWRRSNWSAHEGLVKAFKERLARRRLSDRPLEAVRPANAVPPMRHRAHRVEPRDLAARSRIAAPGTIPNLFVVDASFLPTSAAVNPSLTIAAQALRVADHIAKTDLRAA